MEQGKADESKVSQKTAKARSRSRGGVTEDLKHDSKYIKVACRLCGQTMLFPKAFYKESDFKDGWECKGSLSKMCWNKRIEVE